MEMTLDPPDEVVFVEIKEKTKKHVQIITIEDVVQPDKIDPNTVLLPDSRKIVETAAIPVLPSVPDDMDIVIIDNSPLIGLQSDKLRASNNCTATENVASITNIPEEVDVVIDDNSSCNGRKPDMLQTRIANEIAAEIAPPLKVPEGSVDASKNVPKPVAFRPKDMLRLEKYIKKTKRIRRAEMESTGGKTLKEPCKTEFISLKTSTALKPSAIASESRTQVLGTNDNIANMDVTPSDKHEKETVQKTLRNTVQINAKACGAQDLTAQFMKMWPPRRVPVLLKPFDKMAESGAKVILEKMQSSSDIVTCPIKQSIFSELELHNPVPKNNDSNCRKNKGARKKKAKAKAAMSDLSSQTRIFLSKLDIYNPVPKNSDANCKKKKKSKKKKVKVKAALSDLSSQKALETGKRKLNAIESCECSSSRPMKSAKVLPDDFAGCRPSYFSADLTGNDILNCTRTTSTTITCNGDSERNNSRRSDRYWLRRKTGNQIVKKDAHPNDKPPSLPSEAEGRCGSVTVSLADSTSETSTLAIPKKARLDKGKVVELLGTNVNPILILDLSCTELKNDAPDSNKTCSEKKTQLMKLGPEIEVVNEVSSADTSAKPRSENSANVRQECSGGKRTSVDIELICEITVPPEKDKTTVPLPASKTNVAPTFEISVPGSATTLPLTRFTHPLKESAPVLYRTIFNERAAVEIVAQPLYPSFPYNAFQIRCQNDRLLPIPNSIMHSARIEAIKLAENFATCGAVNPPSVLPQVTANTSNFGSLRPIAIDGSNVAFSHGKERYFSCKGIKICIEYFLKRGHTVKAFVPQYRRKAGYGVVDQPILETLGKTQLVVFTPSRDINGRNVACYDDRFIVEYSSQSGAVIVSNDNYRDLMQENPSWRNIIHERLLMYAFADDHFLVPEDPLGKNGPRLNQFLKF